MGVAVDAVGIARAKALDKDRVPRSFDKDVPVAVAEDPAATTGTVGALAKSRVWQLRLLGQAACGYAAASLRTIGTSFFFSGSSRSSVRPRYVSAFRYARRWSRYSIPACTRP